MAELTVLVPVKQIDASMLREAIRSLVKQTLCDLRILILCASDADATSRVVDEFQDERIEIVRCDESDTISEQLNRGIELADTDLIARADADDINERWRLERQVRFMKSDLDTAVVGTALTIINNEGVPIGIRDYSESHVEIAKAMCFGNSVAHPSVMFRRDAVIQAGGYRYSGRPAQDYELWSRMIQQGYRFANLADAGVRYRLHSSSTKSSRQKQTLRSTLDIKRTYWVSSMTLSARIRYWLEHLLLLLPAVFVDRAFIAWQFRSPDLSAVKDS